MELCTILSHGELEGMFGSWTAVLSHESGSRMSKCLLT